MPKPRKPIRRFDVYAEYMRQKALTNGMSQEQAKGYGIWLAKMTASALAEAPLSNGEGLSEAVSFWREFDGEPQTDQVFDAEIVDRMGREFYDQIFSRVIGRALQKGRAYQEIRDEIRKDWKP